MIREVKSQVEEYGNDAADARKQIDALNTANKRLAGNININDLSGDYNAKTNQNTDNSVETTRKNKIQ